MKKFLSLLMGTIFLASVHIVRADEMGNMPGMSTPATMSKDDGMSGMKMGKETKSKNVTLTGILVDISCYVEDGSTANDHNGMKACGTECLKGGSPAGLLVGKKLYTLAFPAPAFQDYVGMKVEITGKLYSGEQLIPRKAFMIMGGKKEEIEIKGKSMM